MKQNVNVQQGKCGYFVKCSCLETLFCTLSASCVHVSALLHAVVALTPNVDACDDHDDDLSVTSLPCKWKVPQKCKHQALQVSKAHFDKLEYGQFSKYCMQSLDSYDPRPDEFRNTSAERLPQLLADVKDKGLSISLLLNSSTCT